MTSWAWSTFWLLNCCSICLPGHHLISLPFGEGFVIGRQPSPSRCSGVKADVFTKLFEACSGTPDMEYAIVDAVYRAIDCVSQDGFYISSDCVSIS